MLAVKGIRIGHGSTISNHLLLLPGVVLPLVEALPSVGVRPLVVALLLESVQDLLDGLPLGEGLLVQVLGLRVLVLLEEVLMLWVVDERP